MNTKTILAGLAGGVFSFFAGWLVYGILLMDYYTANTIVYEGLMKEPPDMIFLSISNLAWGFLFAWVFNKMGNITSFGSGFTSGLPIAFIVFVMFNTSIYAFYNLNSLTLVLVDIVPATLLGGLVAGVVAYVLGTGKKE